MDPWFVVNERRSQNHAARLSEKLLDDLHRAEAEAVYSQQLASALTKSDHWGLLSPPDRTHVHKMDGLLRDLIRRWRESTALALQSIGTLDTKVEEYQSMIKILLRQLKEKDEALAALRKQNNQRAAPRTNGTPAAEQDTKEFSWVEDSNQSHAMAMEEAVRTGGLAVERYFAMLDGDAALSPTHASNHSGARVSEQQRMLSVSSPREGDGSTSLPGQNWREDNVVTTPDDNAREQRIRQEQQKRFKQQQRLKQQQQQEQKEEKKRRQEETKAMEARQEEIRREGREKQGQDERTVLVAEEPSLSSRPTSDPASSTGSDGNSSSSASASNSATRRRSRRMTSTITSIDSNGMVLTTNSPMRQAESKPNSVSSKKKQKQKEKEKEKEDSENEEPSPPQPSPRRKMSSWV